MDFKIKKMINHFVLSAQITFVSTLALGILVLLDGRWRIKYCLIFSGYCLAIAFWCFFISFFNANFQDPYLIYGRSLHLFAILIPALFFWFVDSFLKEKSKFGQYLFIPVGFFLVFNFFTKLLINGITNKTQYSYPSPSSLYPFFFLYFFLVTLLAIIKLFKAYKNSEGARRNQIKYLLLFSIFGYIGGSKNALIVYNLHPFLIYPYGMYAIPIYVIGVVYAIVKYRLLDIRLAISNTAIFIAVYALVLGVPFLFGYKYHQWQISTWAMLVLATAGPFIFIYLYRKEQKIVYYKNNGVIKLLYVKHQPEWEKLKI